MRKKRKTFRGALVILLALVAAVAIVASCEQRREAAADRLGSEHKVEIQRGAQGTEVEFHTPEASEADRQLDEAGQHLQQGARELGTAVTQGARAVGQKLGPAARQAGEQLQQAGREVGSKVGPALSDAALTASIKAKLLSDSNLHGSSIDVSTSAGEVTLSGRAATPEQKAEAEKVALKTDGVRRVVNNVEIGG